jgi:toxin ParE1/3/4
MRLEFSPLAETDLEAIGDYIASDSPGNVLRFVQALGEQCRKIAKSPMAYVARPERILHSAMDFRSELFPANPDSPAL